MIAILEPYNTPLSVSNDDNQLAMVPGPFQYVTHEYTIFNHGLILSYIWWRLISKYITKSTRFISELRKISKKIIQKMRFVENIRSISAVSGHPKWPAENCKKNIASNI